MKTFTRLLLGLSLLLAGSGCQHANAPSLAMQEKFFSSLQGSDPATDRVLRRAHYHQLVSRHDLALKELSAALQDQPQNVRILNVLGNCYDRLGNYAQAQETYEQILALEAGNSPARNNLGYSHYLAGNLTRAEQIFQEAITRNPQDTMARNNLGLVMCRQGREQQALGLWQKHEGEYAAREKLHHVLTYLGKSPEKSVQVVALEASQSQRDTAKPLTSQEKPAARASLPELTGKAVKPVAARTPAGSEAELEVAPAKTAKASGSPGQRPPGIPVQVEEVEMVIQPASYTPPPLPSSPVAGETVLVAPQTARPATKPAAPDTSLARKKTVSLPDSDEEFEEEEEERPRYRPRPWRRYWRPRMITYAPPAEPPKPKQAMNSYLQNESLYQPQNPARGQSAVVF